MNRAGLTSVGVPGCNADVLEIFQKWKAQGRLNIRIFCIDGAAAETPEQVDRALEQIPADQAVSGRQLHRQYIFWRKRLWAAA